MKDKWEAIAIYGGLLAAIFTTWMMGRDIHNGLHILSVLVVRMFLLLFALSFHEWAHGAVALLFGDDTAKKSGRLTLNPLAHFDAIGLIGVPGIFMAIHAPFSIGWAAPVPVDYKRMKYRRLGMALTALAGPFSNFFMAFCVASVLHIFHISGEENIFTSALWTFSVMNIGLGLFNMLPIYPMDGGRVLLSILPVKVRDWMESRETMMSFIALVIVCVLPIVISLVFGKNLILIIESKLMHLIYYFTGTPHLLWFSNMSQWMKN